MTSHRPAHFRVRPATAEAWIASRFRLLRRDPAKGELWLDRCPICGDDKPVARRSYNVRGGWFHCLRNQCRGGLLDLIRAVEGTTSLAGAARILAEFGDASPASLAASAGNPLAWAKRLRLALFPDQPDPDAPTVAKGSLPGRYRVDFDASVAGRAALAYARRRRIPEALLASGRVGWLDGETIPPAWKRRLLLPVFEAGRLAFPQGRAIDDDRAPKMYYPPRVEWGSGATDHVWGLDAVDPALPILICEGAISAISAGPQAVAVMGPGATARQVNLIAERGVREAVILRETEISMEKAVEAAARLAAAGVSAMVASLFAGDPNENSEQLPAVIEAARPIRGRTDLIRARLVGQVRPRTILRDSRNA